ncbi:MAG: CAP domain-containing protein, partial [Gammaproteobacteria bacterium]
VGPLTLNRNLTGAALAHSSDMAIHAEFDHRGHDGSTPTVRVTRAGYGKYIVVGENIAAGAMTPVEAIEGWLASPAHCENIMDGRFTEIGIAYAANLNASAGMYWTQDFATRR